MAKKTPDVDTFLSTLTHARKAEVIALRAALRAAVPALTEQVKWLEKNGERPMAAVNGDFYKSANKYPGDPEGLDARTLEHRKSLWLQFEHDLGDGPWVLGTEFSALDVYVAAMVHWRPRRAWFAANAPSLSRIAEATLSLPLLMPVWQRNFRG